MKQVLFLIGILLAGSTFAQKKPKLGKAETALLNGELAEAKAITDQGIVHEKTKDDPKAWYLHGLVLGVMDTTSSVDGGNMEEAIAALQKADAMKKGNSELYIGSLTNMVMYSNAIQSFWAYYINKGVAAFQNEDAVSALDNFEKCGVIIPDSLDAFYYAGLAGISSEKYDRALTNFNTYIEGDGNEEDAYIKAAYIYNQIEEDNEKALEVIRKAKAKYPDSKVVGEWEFKILFAMDKVDEAMAQLESQIEKDPGNTELHFSLGVMRDQAGQPEEAMQKYRDALEIDPNHFNSLFNLGVMYRNKLVDKSKEKNALGISKADLAKGKKLDKEIVEVSKEALPFWEKCLEIKPEDQTTLETLQYIYIQVKDYDKAEVVQEKLEKLGYK